MAELSSVLGSLEQVLVRNAETVAHVPHLFLYDLQAKERFFFPFIDCVVFGGVIVTNLPKT